MSRTPELLRPIGRVATGGEEFVDSLDVFFSMHEGEGLSSAGPDEGMTLSECLLVEPRQGLTMFFRKYS